MSQLFLKNLNLSNFRSFKESRNFHFHKNIVFVIGANASGKSTILEAIQAASISVESWAESERQLVSLGAEQPFFSIEAQYSYHGRDWSLQLKGGMPAMRSIKLNGVEYKTTRSAKDDLMKVVSFRARESIEIVRGSPSERREWLDSTLKLTNTNYAETLRRYTRIVEQRNSLLKQSSEGKKSRASVLDELELWDDEMSKYGFELMQHRKNFLYGSEIELNTNYKQIAGSDLEELGIAYLPCIIADSETEFKEKLFARRDLDLIRGQSSVGPHRDDFAFLINGYEAKHYASQGQQRTAALSLKLLQLQKWEDKLGTPPVLLLDDVAAELDLKRQEALFSTLPKGIQVFITTTHLSSLPALDFGDYQILNLNKTF